MLLGNVLVTGVSLWRAEHREEKVTLRTDAFEGIMLMAMERAFEVGRESCGGSASDRGGSVPRLQGGAAYVPISFVR